MVSVELHGGVFSSTLFDQIFAPSNQEGLLLGHMQLQTKNTISDANINDQSESLVYVIESTVHCPTPRYFYDKDGQILEDKLNKLLNRRPLNSVIGWYRSRQHATLDMSMWERSVHYNLCNYLISQQVENQTNPMFGIFTCEPNRSLSTRLQSTKFLILKDNGKFKPIKLNVKNLGNTSSQYKLPVSLEYGKSAVQYKAVCDSHRSRLIDEPHQTVHSTKQMDSIANDMCCKLQELCTQVEESEVEVHTLLEEIEAMKKILCATISQSKNLDLETEEAGSSVVPDSQLTDKVENKDADLTEGYLIDLAEYASNEKAASVSPIVKCSLSNKDSFEHIDIIHERPSKLSKGASGTVPSLQVKKTNAAGDAFSFVDELLGESKQLNVPTSMTGLRSNMATATDGDDDEEVSVIHSSPPSSPVY